MGYIIGSWNTQHFTGREKGAHDIDMMAHIILSEGFDIIALQEVMRPEAVQLLKKRLPGWEGCHGDPRSRIRDSNFNLGFAYLWNTRRVREVSKEGMPSIFTQYRTKAILTRNPFYGRFSPNGLPGGAFFEIRLINIHLWYGNNLVTDKAKRLEEFKAASQYIYQSLSTRRYGNFMPAYTIVLGDYNFSAVFCQSQETDTVSYYANTKQEQKTTLPRIKGEAKDGIEAKNGISEETQTKNPADFVNDYDHFGYNDARFDASDVIVSRVNTVNKYMSDDFTRHRKELSDHIPIKLELILNPRRPGYVYTKEEN